MPRYYCDYCDTYLTHDSPSVRKQHNAGYKHKGNVRTYYQQFEAQLNQSLIDQKVKEHLGAFRPVGLPFNQLRPGLPGLPPPQMSIAGNPQMPAGWVPGMRPPVLPRPMSGVPGYAPMPQPQMLAPPGAQMPGQVNNMQRPVGVPSAIPVPGSMGMPASTGGPPMFAPPGPPGYQGGTSAPTNGPPGYQGGTTAPTSGPPGYQGGTTAPTNGPPGYQGGTTAPTSGGGDSSSVNAQAPDSKQ